MMSRSRFFSLIMVIIFLLTGILLGLIWFFNPPTPLIVYFFISTIGLGFSIRYYVYGEDN